MARSRVCGSSAMTRECACETIVARLRKRAAPSNVIPTMPTPGSGAAPPMNSLVRSQMPLQITKPPSRGNPHARSCLRPYWRLIFGGMRSVTPWQWSRSWSSASPPSLPRNPSATRTPSSACTGRIRAPTQDASAVISAVAIASARSILERVTTVEPAGDIGTAPTRGSGSGRSNQRPHPRRPAQPRRRSAVEHGRRHSTR